MWKNLLCPIKAIREKFSIIIRAESEQTRTIRSFSRTYIKTQKWYLHSEIKTYVNVSKRSTKLIRDVDLKIFERVILKKMTNEQNGNCKSIIKSNDRQILSTDLRSVLASVPASILFNFIFFFQKYKFTREIIYIMIPRSSVLNASRNKSAL